MSKFVFSTTGIVSEVKLEELGVYFNHPIIDYVLSDFFDLNEIINSITLQESIDNNYIVAKDEFGVSITNLDDLLISKGVPIFDVDNVSNLISYVGYGSEESCKIQKIVTSPTGYTTFWAEGDENFNKNWDLRLDYSYF
jgi:hypothetical protein